MNVKNKPTPPHEICMTSARLIGGERAVMHGDYAINLGNIAGFWTTFLRQRFGLHQIQLSGADVAHLMALLKIARTLAGGHNIDDYVDAAGYVGLAGGLAERDAALALHIKTEEAKEE